MPAKQLCDIIIIVIDKKWIGHFNMNKVKGRGSWSQVAVI